MDAVTVIQLFGERTLGNMRYDLGVLSVVVVSAFTKWLMIDARKGTG